MKGIKNENDGKKSLHGIWRNGKTPNLEQPWSMSALIVTSYIDAINTKRVQNWNDLNCEGFARLGPLNSYFA